MTAPGIPLVFGWIPFLFSSALFALPLARAARRGRAARRVTAENGKRALLRLLTEYVEVDAEEGLPADHAALRAVDVERILTTALASTAERAGVKTPKVETRDVEDWVRALGGEIDITDQGDVVYRFDVWAMEQRALHRLRLDSTPKEQDPGQVVFSSDSTKETP
jgi:hypothetical protein